MPPARNAKVTLGSHDPVRCTATPLAARLSIARAWRQRATHAAGGRSALERSSLARAASGAWLDGGGLCPVPVRAGGGRGGRLGDVQELQGGAGPLGAADGGHGDRRAPEATVGPAGRRHVTVSSGARARWPAVLWGGGRRGPPGAPLGPCWAGAARGPRAEPAARPRSRSAPCRLVLVPPDSKGGKGQPAAGPLPEVGVNPGGFSPAPRPAGLWPRWMGEICGKSWLWDL